MGDRLARNCRATVYRLSQILLAVRMIFAGYLALSSSFIEPHNGMVKPLIACSMSNHGELSWQLL